MSLVRRCYFAVEPQSNIETVVEPRVVFTTRKLLPATKTDVLPAFQHSNIIYQYLCHCDSRYVGLYLKRCRTGSNNIYQRASQLASFLKIDRPFLVLANLLIIQFPMTLQLVHTSW